MISHRYSPTELHRDWLSNLHRPANPLVYLFVASNQTEMAFRLAATERGAGGKEVEGRPDVQLLDWSSMGFDLLYAEPETSTTKVAFILDGIFDQPTQFTFRSF